MEHQYVTGKTHGEVECRIKREASTKLKWGKECMRHSQGQYNSSSIAETGLSFFFFFMPLVKMPALMDKGKGTGVKLLELPQMCF